MTELKIPTRNFTQAELEEAESVLTALSNTSSRSEKEEILKTRKTDALLWAIERALNPFLNYYNAGEFIADNNIPAPAKPITVTLDQLMDNIVADRINLRTIGGSEYVAEVVASWKKDGLNAQANLLLKILNKDLRCGMGAKTINKALKQKLIPIVPYMRCSLPKQVPLDRLNWKEGVISQEKCDGMFVNVCIDKDPTKEIQMYSRAGSPFDLEALYGDDWLAVEKTLRLAMMEGYQYHGEMLIIDRSTKQILPREEGNGMLNSVLQGGTILEDKYVRIIIWDAIPLKNAIEAEPYDLGYRWRFANLINRYSYGLTKGASPNVLGVVETVITHSYEEAIDHYKKMLSEGKEGTVLKTMTGIWKDTTSRDQIKMKLTVDCDLIIVDYEEGKGKFSGTLGSLVCATSDNKLKVSVGGFTDVMRNEIYSHKEDYRGKIVTVKFNGVMTPKEEGEDYSLFLPRFAEFRLDKSEADSLEKVIEQQESARCLM